MTNTLKDSIIVSLVNAGESPHTASTVKDHSSDADAQCPQLHQDPRHVHITDFKIPFLTNQSISRHPQEARSSTCIVYCPMQDEVMSLMASNLSPVVTGDKGLLCRAHTQVSGL